MRYRILVRDGVALQPMLDAKREVEILEGELAVHAGDIDGLIIRGKTKFGPAWFERYAPRLKVIGRAGVGVDNIDLAAAQEYGVTVVNAPAATTIAVAEHTIGLMLSLVRQIPRANQSLHQGEWLKATLTGSELRGKIIGIVGLGRVGSAVAQRALAFGMQVLACDPFVPGRLQEEFNVALMELGPLLHNSDFVSLHVPLEPDTRHLISAHELALMKPSAYLINTARGDVLDEGALLSALDAGRLAGAALDVFSQEPPGAAPIAQHPRIVCTPHLGAQTKEAQLRAAQDIFEEVVAALEGTPLRWRIV
jgi:D-3-phosphoglycerate dehydrogenase